MNSSKAVTDKKLKAFVGKFTRGLGARWSALVSGSTEIVVFGSHAVGLQTALSDMDLLIITKDKHPASFPKIEKLDLICVTDEQVHSGEWLKSELAGHIAAYGRWLRGAGDWRNEALDSNKDAAADAKRRRIARLTNSLNTHWNRLTPEFRMRNLVTLRREGQRLGLLEAGIAVAPTRLLDIWAARDSVPEIFQVREWAGVAGGQRVPLAGRD